MFSKLIINYVIYEYSKKISKIKIKTEPPPTKKLSETQLDEVVNGTSSIIELCGLEKVHCHTQVCVVNLIYS